MKTLYAIAALALMSGSAQAWDAVTTCTYSQFAGRTCRTSVIADQPRDYAQEAEDEAAKQESLPALAAAPNGGAGVSESGRYMSFYSAGLYVEPGNFSGGAPAQIPAINDLFNYISGLDYFGQSTKSPALARMGSG